MLDSIARAQDLRLKLLSAPRRRTGEGQLRAVLVKHFGEDLGAVNGSRGFERAFREMLWASEASELMLLCHMDPCQSDSCRLFLTAVTEQQQQIVVQEREIA